MKMPDLTTEEELRAELEALTEKLGFTPGEVPCGGCARCCYRDAVRLLPGDDPNEYETTWHPFLRGELMLKHKPDGSCIYLANKGPDLGFFCSIHDRRPQMCRHMDCRLIAMDISYTKARKLDHAGRLRMPIWTRGRHLLRLIERKESGHE